jgi:hypothetical protein
LTRLVRLIVGLALPEHDEGHEGEDRAGSPELEVIDFCVPESEQSQRKAHEGPNHQAGPQCAIHVAPEPANQRERDGQIDDDQQLNRITGLHDQQKERHGEQREAKADRALYDGRNEGHGSEDEARGDRRL